MNQAEEVKRKLDIVDFIREYIPVKAVGANFQALCPFHGEKTPSLVISPEKQIWHCFGCAKGGDIIAFLMEIESLSFPEALRQLAPRAGVILKSQDPASFNKRNRLLDLMELSVKYYHHLLYTPIATKALEYLYKRGLTDDIIKEWRIGYSPDAWDSLLTFLATRPLSGAKYNSLEMTEAGVMIKKEGNNHYYDRFRDRIMFPISDANANAVAFTARINPEKETSNTQVGKYINSPQSMLYDKSRILFGLDKAKAAIKEKNYAIVVEGQMDVITCHQFGFKNVVASSGTALTSEQISLLKRYSQNIALCFDADKAGQLAADRGIKEAMAQGLNIKVIIIPNGKDPDDSLRQDLDSFVLAVKNAKPVMEYYFEKIKGDLNLSLLENKKEISEKMLAMIAKLSNKIEANYWLKIVAQSLNIDENVLRESFSQEKPVEAPREEKQKQVIDLKTREEQLSELLLALAIKFPQFISLLSSKLDPIFIALEELSLFYKNLIIYYNKNNDLNYELFRDYLQKENPQLNIVLDRLVLLGEKDFYAYNPTEVQEEIIKSIVELKKYYFQKQINIAQKAMAEAEKSSNEEDIIKILEEIKRLNDLQRNNQIN